MKHPKIRAIAQLVIMANLMTPCSQAMTFEQMLERKGDKSRPFMGDQPNIKWISHESYFPKGQDHDDIELGQIDIGRIDLDGDGKDEMIKAIWDHGVSDHFLTIEIYFDGKLVSSLTSKYGIQPNYMIKDLDHDGKNEIVIWSGLWDSGLPGEPGVTDKNYQGHSGLHRYVVATYKLKGHQYQLSSKRTTKKKYEPFGQECPKD